MSKLVVIGGGESGVGAALLAKQKGFQVFLSDSGVLKNQYQNELDQYQIPYETGGHQQIETILAADLVVKSPGVPNEVTIIQQIKAANITVISEIEFASRYTQTPIIAITGSNGKTTTTSLTAHLFKNAGYKVGLGGNIGNSFAKLVMQDDYDIYVLEVSSFQLDDTTSFRPHIAILLNITPDHLNRYQYDISKYAAAKFRIAAFQQSSDFFIYNADDELTNQYLKNHKIKAKKIAFSLEDNNQLVYASDQEIIIKYPNEFRMTVKELALMGKHNVANSMASAVAGNLLKMRKDTMRSSLTHFDAVPHRLEPVLSIHGIQFVNDSKATNVNATYYALQSMTTPVVWIVGGEDKGNNYEELLPWVKKKVHAIVCLGIDNSKIIQAFDAHVDTIVETDNMKDAVRKAYMLGKKGDTVLLSPACASFDLFQNYEERGNLFKQEIKNL